MKTADTKPQTMKALYESITGDVQHQRAIDGQLRKLAPEKQEILRARAAGATLQELATQHGTTRATIRSYILRSCEAIRKRIHKEPRYSVPHPRRLRSATGE